MKNKHSLYTISKRRVYHICIYIFTLVQLFWMLKGLFNNKYLPETENILYSSLSKEGYGMNEERLQQLCPLETEKLLSRRCLDLRAQSIARTFDNKPFRQWCKPSRYENLEENTYNKDTKELEGLLYVKVPKTASSSIAGVVMRIHDLHHCDVIYEHTKNKGHDFLNHSLSKSFLIASVRKPSSQILSYIQYFGLVTKSTSDNAVMNALHGRRLKLKDGKGGYQFRWLSLKETEDIPKFMTSSPENRTILPQPEEVHRHVRELVNEYDFLIVAERLDESLTAMALITGLDIATVFIASSKVAGSFNLARFISNPRKQNLLNTCQRQFKLNVSDSIKSYLKEDVEWRLLNYADELLYKTANESLDRTIDKRIGRERFEKSLLVFRKMVERAREFCGVRMGTGCSINGTVEQPIEPCYDRDYGCGYRCFDEFFNTSEHGCSWSMCS